MSEDAIVVDYVGDLALIADPMDTESILKAYLLYPQVIRTASWVSTVLNGEKQQLRK